MHVYVKPMASKFESEKNKKALLYTATICGALLLLFFLISWRIMPPAAPVAMDLIEINLGNNEEGFGKIQPLRKGNKGPSSENIVPQKAAQQAIARVTPEDNATEDAAPVTRPAKTARPKAQDIADVPAPKPQKPKITYNGPGNNTGNNPTEDNNYRYQGNNPGGKGDAGDPNGNKESYGNSPGGRIGGPMVTKGNRKIVNRNYSFKGELSKAIVYAIIKVSPAGKGTFVSFSKGSTEMSQPYADAIRNYLNNIYFNKSDQESLVTVQFNFNIN
jgi:hypothetical protein